MEQSPDDVLLLLLQYLEVPDVLNCRVVSKRLAGLALHRDVWRHRQLRASDPWVCTVLRLAPCLEYVNVTCPFRCDAPYTTSCAVTKLDIRVMKDGAAHATQAALVIRNQEALGQLKRISLALPPIASWASVLLGALASVSDLEDLDVISEDQVDTPVVSPLVLHCVLPSASLKKFAFSYSLEWQSFCTAVLSAHNTTLQEVMVYYLGANRAEPLLAPLLASMPNLKELSCPALPQLDALLACSSLRELTLAVMRPPRSAHVAAVKFLRGAAQLQELSLVIWPGSVDDDVYLVLALGSTATSSLEYLDIELWYKVGDCEKFLQSLARVLPALRALRHLRLVVPFPPNQLLCGITPATAPALWTLELETCFDGGCVVPYVESDAVKGFLSSNPMLHLKLPMPRKSCHNEHCQLCSLVDFSKVNVRRFHFFTVFTHKQDEDCSVEHTTDTFWLWLPV